MKPRTGYWLPRFPSGMEDMSSNESQLRRSLVEYSERVREIRSDPHHSPETSLYGPFESLFLEISDVLERDGVRIVQQYRQKGVGAPDFGVRTRASTSYIEAKEPDADLGNLRGRDREQFERYMRLGNVLYTDFSELRLFQGGERAGIPTEIVPSAWLDPRGPKPDPESLRPAPLLDVVARFLSFSLPSITTVKDLAAELARATWLLRTAVEEATKEEDEEESPLDEIYHEFRDVLFYELTETEFSDAYAQTLAYGLLLARQATDTELTTDNVSAFLDTDRHRLLSATLRLLSMPEVVNLIGWTIDNLVSVVNQVSGDLLRRDPGQRDPLLYFYEDFLAEYDPALRKQRGVYYTPPEVVDLQSRVVEHVLRHDFGRPYGFADEGVNTLDPAVGTGTYLISALDRGCDRVRAALGPDSVPEAATALADRLHGFEILVGPYTVAHFRLSASVTEHNPDFAGQLPIVLTDTLLPAEGEVEVPTRFGFMSEPLNAERELADKVKQKRQIMVILGNPPYRRAKAESGWVWDTLLESFREPVRAEHSLNFKNLADLYVWFYRWAIWKLFESESAPDACVLSFISNSRWILGGAFGGMRQQMRQYFDRIYVIDLHGDNRAPLPAGVTEDENIFDIQVGVAITICVADGNASDDEAKVFYYGDTWGKSADKISWLETVDPDLSNVEMEEVKRSGTAPFFPSMDEVYKRWPSLRDDVMTFAHSGVQTKRDHLVVAPTREALREKIEHFLALPDSKKAETFSPTSAKDLGGVSGHSFDPSLVRRYSYRNLDEQFLYNHPEFLDRRRPRLQSAWGGKNIGFATMGSGHGSGPVVSVHRHLPDMNVFRQRSSYVFPLWDAREADPTQESLLESRVSNLNANLVAELCRRWGREDVDQVEMDLFAYIFAVLNAPSFSVEFADELAQGLPRVPIPTSAKTFHFGVALGSRLIQLHTFQDGYPADGSILLVGSPERIDRADYDAQSGRLRLSEAGYVAPVTPEAWSYSVSGYEVVRQWVLRRTEIPFDLTTRRALLDLLWVVERTVELGTELDELLSQLLEGGTLSREELGIVPPERESGQ